MICRPKNKEELFNLRHSQARNVIERVFGVFKRRFTILKLAPEYGLDTQARIPASLCAIYNFSRAHDNDDDRFQHTPETVPPDPETAANPETADTGRNIRDQIAQEMWENYQKKAAENHDPSVSDNE